LLPSAGLLDFLGDKADEVAILALVGHGLYILLCYKPYRKWKVYKKIRGENAKKTLKDEVLFPPGPPSSAFPDRPPEDEPKE